MRKPRNEFLTKEIGQILELIDNEKYQIAFKKVNRLLSNTPLERNYLLALKGLILGRMGKRDKSNELLNSLLKKDLKIDIKELVLISKSDNLIKKEKYKEADLILDKLLSLTPKNHTVLEFKGRVLYGLKKYNEAITLLKKALQSKPNCIASISLIGACYLQEKKFERAVYYYTKVHKKNPNDLRALKMIFNAYYRWKNIPRANRFIDKILEIEQDFSAHAYKADILSLMEKHDVAVKHYERALFFTKASKICPKCGKRTKTPKVVVARLLEHYALSLIKLGRLKEAKKIINRGLNLDRLNKVLVQLKPKVT